MLRTIGKRLGILLLVLTLALSAAGCTAVQAGQTLLPAQQSELSLERSDFISDAAYVKYAYEAYNNYQREDGVVIWPVELPEENPYVITGMQEAIALAEEGTGVLLIGSPWCRLCRMLVTLIVDALEDEQAVENEGTRQIYYLNPDEIDRDDPLYPEFCEKVLKPMYSYMQAAAQPYTNVYGTQKFIDKKAALTEAESAEVGNYLYTVSFWYDGKLLGMNIGTTPYYIDSQTPPGEEDRAAFAERFWEIAGLFGTDLCDYC